MGDSREDLKNLIDILTDDQFSNLSKYVNYHFSKISEDSEIDNAKKDIYLCYKTDIAPLINKIEIYSHRLDINLYSGIETIFRCMASIEKNFGVDYTKDDALKCYRDLKSYAKNLQSELSIYLIKIYLQTIKMYKKKLTKFNYKGIYPDFKKDVDAGIKNIKRKLKLGCKLYEIKFIKNNDSNICFKIDEDAQSEHELLRDALNVSEYLIKLCENKHSDIISSGYSNVFLDKILPVLSILLSIVFSTIGAIGLIILIKN